MPLLLIFAAQKICAQLAPADDFFNGGAQLYISNNIPAALEKTENGLKLYPDDVKLKKLEKLLKQQQQSQNNQSQQNQNQQKNQNQKNNPSQQKQQNQNSNSQNKEQAQQNSQQNQPSQNQQQREKSNAAQSQKKSENQNNEQAEMGQPGAMTPQEAKQLLDAQKDDEQLLTLKPKEKPENQNQPFKDW